MNNDFSGVEVLAAIVLIVIIAIMGYTVGVNAEKALWCQEVAKDSRVAYEACTKDRTGIDSCGLVKEKGENDDLGN